MKIFDRIFKMQKVKTTLLATLCAALCVCLGFGASGFLKDKATPAAATASGTTSLVLSNGATGITTSQQQAYKDLINAIGRAASGNSTATYSYATMANAVSTVKADKLSSIKVTFGGYYWNIAYVSKTRNPSDTTNAVGSAGDVVVTLYLADNGKKAGLATDLVSQFSPHAVNATNVNYPSSMYSTSLVRASLVGSPYSTSQTATSLTTGPVSSTWTRFTNNSQLGKYISTPAQIAYQETEYTDTYSYYFPNDAYGQVSGNKQWYSSGSVVIGDIQKKSHYGDWKTDKLWLPSMSETGWDATNVGMWGLSATQRGNTNTASSDSSSATGHTGYAWLRSGNTYNANSAYYLYSSGGNNAYYTNRFYAVRPALHLNLKSAASAAGAVNTTVTEPTFTTSNDFTLSTDKKTATTTYNGASHTLNLTSDTGVTITAPSGWTVSGKTITVPASAAAGNHTITLKLKNTGDKWADNTTADKKLTVTINQANADPPVLGTTEGFTLSADKLTGTTTFSTSSRTFGLASYTTGLNITLPTGWTRSGTAITIPANTAHGIYAIKFAPTANYKWSDDSTGEKTITIAIDKASVAAPAISSNGTLTYSASAQTVTLNAAIPAGITPTLPSGWTLSADKKKINVPAGAAAKDYTVTLALASANYKWSDGTTGNKTLTVTVSRAAVTQPTITAGSALIYSSSAHTVTLSAAIPTGVTCNLPEGWTISGTTITVPAGAAIGAYKITLTPDANHKWNAGESVTAARELTVNIESATVTPPAISTGASLNYSTVTQTVTLDNLPNSVTATLPDGWTHIGTTITVPANTTVGTYKIKLTLAANYKWSDGTTAAKELTVTVSKANPNVTASLASGNYYVGRLLSEVPVPTNGHADATAGTFSWNSPSAKISSTSYTANWTFTPTDTTNYNTITGTVTVNAHYELSSITISGAKDSYFAFDTFSTAGLTVTANYKEGKDPTVISLDNCTITTPYGAAGRDSFTVEDSGKNVTITYTENGITKSATVKVTVSPKQVTGVTFEDMTVTYNGATQRPAISGDVSQITNGDVTVKYLVKGTSTEFTGKVNVGVYEVTAHFESASGNWTLADITVTMTIQAKELSDDSVSGIDTSYPYTSKPHTPLPTVKTTLSSGETTLVKDTDYTVSYSTSDYTVGTTVTVTITGTGNYSGTVTRSFTIVKATLGFAWEGNETEWIYNAQPQGPVGKLTGVAENDTSRVVPTLKYKGRGGTVYAESTVKPTAAGTYTLTLSLEGDYPNYNSFQPQSIDFEIKKATPTVSTGYVNYDPATDKLYTGGKMPELEIKSATFGDGSTVAGKVQWKEGSVLQTGTHNYTWEFIPDDAANFNIQTGIVSLTVVEPNISKIVVSWKDGVHPTVYLSTTLEQLKAYLKVDATLDDGTVVEDINTYELSGSWGAGNTPTEAGTYTVNVLRNGRPASIEVTYAGVAPDHIEISAPEGGEIKKNYNAFDKFDTSSIVVKVVFNDGSEKIVPFKSEGVSDGYTLKYFRDGVDFLCAGNSYVTVEYNGKTTQVSGLSVAKIEFDTSDITLSGATYNWDGSSRSILLANAEKFTIGTVSYTYEKKNASGGWDLIDGVDSVSDAGEYRVTATFTVTGDVNIINYHAVPAKKATLTINKVDYDGVENITFADDSRDYNHGNAIDLSDFTVKNVPNGVTVAYAWKDASGAAVSVSDIINAGTYTVTATFTVDGNHNEIADMTATLTVNKIDPVLNPQIVGDDLVVGVTLNQISLAKSSSDINGTYEWDDARNDGGRDHALVFGQNIVYYIFTPAETEAENYNVVHGELKITVANKMLTSISASITQRDTKLYSSYSIQDLLDKISDDFEDGKLRLVVTAHFRDGTGYPEEVIKKGDYELFLLNNDQTLGAGLYKLGVRYTFGDITKETDIYVDVIKVELESIEVSFEQNGQTIFTSNDVDDLTQMIADGSVSVTVTGTNNDGRPCTDSNLLGNYTLSGDWSGLTADGTYGVTLTVNGTTVKNTFDISVTKVVPTEVTAEYDQNGQKIYTSQTIDAFEQLIANGGVSLTVTLHYNDGSADTLTLNAETLGYTVAITGKTDSDKFAVGDTVTVTCGDLSVALTPEVTLVLVSGVTAELNDKDNLIYTDTSFDELRGRITVTAHFNNGESAVVTSYDLAVAGGADKLPFGPQVKVIVSYNGDDKTDDCQSFNLIIGVTKHETTITYNGTEYTYNGEEQLIEGGVTLNHGQTTEITYTLADGSVAKFKDVPVGGELIVTVTVAETEDYFGQTREFRIKINKVRLTVTANDASIVFGDAPANDGVSYEGFLSDDDATDLTGTLVYSYDYAQNGQVGAYAISVGGVTSGNYDINFVNGTLTVTPKTVNVSWTGGDDLVFDGKAHTPVAVYENVLGEQVVMTVAVQQDGQSVQPVEAGDYVAVASANTQNYVFENHEYEYTIAPAKISVKSSSDQWFDEENLYTGEMVLITLDAKDENDAYKFISVVGGKESGITFKFSTGYSVSEGNIPAAKDETNWLSGKPENIVAAGRYIVNYCVSAPSHEDYYGQWKIEIVDASDPAAKFVTIIFVKPLELTYGAVPTTAEELEELAKKLINEEFVTVSGGITKERLAEVATVRLAIDNDNEIDGVTSVGNYTPYFVIKDEFANEYGDYSIFYKRDNLSENQNIGQVVLGSRGVRVSWDKNSFEFNGEIQLPVATVTDEISGSQAQIVINPRQTEYEVTLDGRLIKLNIVITGDAQQVGGYSITVSCDNANFKVDDPFLTVSITPVDDGTIGLSPTIIWIIVGAAVVAALVILGMAIALKRRKSSVQYVSDGSDNGGFNDDYVE